jgi:hypothetical protein
MPNADDPEFPSLNMELERLFDKHKEEGKIELLYTTKIFFAQL